MAAVELDGRRPVEVLEGDALLEARLDKPAFESEVVPALDLVREDKRVEGGIIELLGACEGKPVRQGREDRPELEALEKRGEVGFDGHATTSR